MTDKLLRFAPLVRVSTEGQEKMGESLRTQKAQIEAAVKALKGTLISDPWRYSGQEHATAGFERKRFDQLLKDAQRGQFDAVIVCDPSRWSRDNVKSGQGLEVLREAGVRFFAGQVEHDLFDPNAELFLGMTTQINQYVAKIQTQKSIRNRIARSVRGIPTAGKLPYGRTFNRATETWGIDKEKQKKIAWAAVEYLKGEQLPKLAQTLGMGASNLWKILTRRSGDTWEIEFQSKRIAIDEKVTLKIPPLLSPETIKRIHERAEANKTYCHGVIKYEYLLSRAIFCSKCGLALSGQTSNNQNRYYRHSRNLEHHKCDPTLCIRADELEQAVLVRLFATLGDAAGMEAAMLKAIPDRVKIGELRERKSFLESELSKVEVKKNRLIDSIAEGIISKEEATVKMKDIRSREASIKTEVEGIEPQLAEIPEDGEIKRRAKFIQRIVSQIYRSPSQLKRMTFQEKHKLITSFFSGKDAQGHRLGVYVEKDRSGNVKYEIRGIFNQTFKGTLTPDGPDILDLPDVSVEHFQDLKAAVKGKGKSFKQDISGKWYEHTQSNPSGSKGGYSLL
jgi:DNA invertase Pin-like site-specific DNA recombinase